MTDAAAERVFLCIREPSMVLVVRLPDLDDRRAMARCPRAARTASTSITRGAGFMSRATTALVEIDSSSGEVTNVWPIAGPPDVTFFNPASGLVHVAIGEPGLVETIDPRTGERADDDGHRRPHHRAGRAGPALRDFTVAWRRSRPLGHVMSADRS